MPSRMLALLRGLLEGQPEGTPPEQSLSIAIEQCEAASRALREELSCSLERLSEKINSCLENRLLQSEWEARVSLALREEPDDPAGFARRASGQAERHARLVEQAREAATREEETARALELQLVELDGHLDRLAHELELAEAAGSLAHSSERIRDAYEGLRAAMGLEFLEALQELRTRCERERILARAEQSEAEADLTLTPGRRPGSLP